MPQKKTNIGHLVAKEYPTIRSIVIEAMEVVEAVEAIETAEVLRPGKSILRTSESSRFLNSALFRFFEKIFFW